MALWVVLIVAASVLVATAQGIAQRDPSRLTMSALAAWAVAIVFLVAAAGIDCRHGSCHGDYVGRAILKSVLAVVGIVHVVIGAVLAAFVRRAGRRRQRPTGHGPVDSGAPPQLP